MLKEIASLKWKQVMQRKKELPLDELKELLQETPPARDFKGALQRCYPGVALLAEYKKASPAKGPFRGGLEGQPGPVQAALTYREAGAAALSVLTEENYFAGSPAHLQSAKKAAGLPVLRKDFIVDEYQVYESRQIGADAVLLIASLLVPAELKKYIALSRDLGMAAVVEAGREDEVPRAVEAGADIIAINNRDLHTMEVDLNRTLKWGAKVPRDRILLSASGINSREQVQMLVERVGVEAVLVGESLMQSGDPFRKIKELLGQNVYCAR